MTWNSGHSREPDPDAGLRALRDVLTPDGTMHVMVYATYGRAGIYMMQESGRLLGLSASEMELRNLGATIRALHPIIRSPAYRSGRQISLTQTHSPMHFCTLRIASYTVPQLYAWLQR